MFNKKDYKAAFSKVRASEDTYLEVLNMANRRNKTAATGRRAVVLIAAVVALMAMTVTAFAAEEISGWFQSFFVKNTETDLTEQQLELIAEYEQIITEKKKENGWTVELRSAMHDDSAGYIIIGVTAPEGINMEPECDEQGNRLESFTPGNGGIVGGMAGAPDILTAPKGVVWHNWGYSWEEDGDGLDNTKNLIIQLNPDLERCAIDPFDSGAEYYIYIENIVREYEDEAYRQELLKGKYAGQADVIFSSEETERLQCVDVLVEGIWDFSISFADTADSNAHHVELLTGPVSTKANIFRKIGMEITDYVYVQEKVTLNSVVMRPLTVTFYYEDCDGAPSFTSVTDEQDMSVYVVMKDGNRIELLPYGSSGTNYVTLDAEQPIVFEEVDHILLADGTIIPMPELETE